VFHWGWRGRWVGGGCFFWVLPKRSLPRSDQHIKDIIQQWVIRCWYVIGTEKHQLHKISHWTDKYVFWWLVSFHHVVGASIITKISTPSFPISGHHWTKRQRGREVNPVELNPHPRPCPWCSLFLCWKRTLISQPVNNLLCVSGESDEVSRWVGSRSSISQVWVLYSRAGGALSPQAATEGCQYMWSHL